MPVALQKWLLQVECTDTLPVDGSIDLPVVHLLDNACGLTTLGLRPSLIQKIVMVAWWREC